ARRWSAACRIAAGGESLAGVAPGGSAGRDRTRRTDSSGSTPVSSRSSKSDGFKSSTGRPRASGAATSMGTRRGAEAGAGDGGAVAVARLLSEDWMPMAAVAIGAAATSSSITARMLARDSEADELLGVAVLIARLDLEDVLAGRKRRDWKVDLLLASLWRGRRLQLVHRAAGAVQDVHLQWRTGRPVGGHADDEAIGAAEFTRSGRHGLRVGLQLVQLGQRPRAENRRRAERPRRRQVRN